MVNFKQSGNVCQTFAVIQAFREKPDFGQIFLFKPFLGQLALEWLKKRFPA